MRSWLWVLVAVGAVALAAVVVLTDVWRRQMRTGSLREHF
jgi:hypothetical protein